MYPLIYRPLPTSMWLHNMALRYVRMVQGAYMRQNGVTESKRAENGLIPLV